MKVKVLCTAIVLCLYGIALSAQKGPLSLEPLPSRSIIGYAVLMQLPPTCQCLKTYSPRQKQKQGPVFSIDILISPFWDTVREDRIKNRTIQFGGSATPWKETIMFGGWPIPRIIFTASNFRTSLEGGIMKALNASPSRTMEQARLILDGSIWHALIGAEGFFGQEQILLISKGVNFNADFRRRSFGGQGWLGMKFGDFNRSFIAGRYGRGYAWTGGETRFVIPSIGELDWLPLYLEEFKTVSISVEGKVKVKWISQSVRFDRVEYERVALSPDPLRFGENRLEEMWLRAETEIVPFSRVRFLRGVVIWTKDFRDQNRLMFVNDYSSVRVFLRLAF